MTRTSIATVACAAILGLAGCQDGGKPVLVGMADSREILVAAKLAGRLAEVRVQEGDHVRAGDTIALLSSPEVSAKVAQAAGMAKSAQARLSMARKGARSEEIRMAATQAAQATEGRKLAESTWRRIEKLQADSAISRQQADEAEFRWRAAQEMENAALARLQMVRKGARPEEIEAAEGLVQSADNALLEAKSWQKEVAVLAPCDGVVQKRYLGAGEIAGAGAPIAVLIRPEDVWVALPAREDQLAGMQVGKTLTGEIPALGKTAVFKVSWMTAMGDFATWRSTTRKGEADLRSFEVRLTPQAPVAGLLPGMTVRFQDGK
jgi:HlyD family secretion protein